MSDANEGPELTTEEAAEHLLRLRDTLGPDQLREAFETGGGLMEHEENRLREALDVLGKQRTAEILDVEIPDSGLPGEQVTIGGEPVSGRVPEERAEPVPDDTASLSEFGDGDGDSEDHDDDVSITARDPETGDTTELEAPRNVNGWEWDADPPPGRGVHVWNDPTTQDDRFVFVEKTGTETWLAGLRHRAETNRRLAEPVNRSSGSGRKAIQDAIELMREHELAGDEITHFDVDEEDIQPFTDVENRAEDFNDRVGSTTEAPAFTEEEAVDVVQRALGIMGPDPIEAFLDPDEIAPLGQAVSFQLSGAVETLGRERIRDIADIEGEDTSNG